MKSLKDRIYLYAITDRRWSKDEEEFYLKVEESLKGGVKILQMREKNKDKEFLIKEASKLRSLCNIYGVKLIINDFIDVAKLVGADGVHLGQEDENLKIARKILGETSIIGISAKTIQDAVRAENEKADYIGVGAVFQTDTKNTSYLEKKDFISIRKKIKIPIVAIGGISYDNLNVLKEYKMDAAAIISDIYSKDVNKIKEHCIKIRERLEDIIESEGLI